MFCKAKYFNKKMSVTISLNDDFDWKDYEREVYTKIINSSKPIKIVWDLHSMTQIPSFEIVIKQIHLMRVEKERINRNVINSTIIVNSKKLQNFLNFVMENFYTPQNPVKIITLNT